MVQSRSPFLGLPSDFRVKILDFGLARITSGRSHLTNPGLLMGTPGFMSPEQAEGKVVDSRSDLFSLGCLLYELSTGAPPFSGANPMTTLMAVLSKTPKPVRELNRGLPPALITLIEHLLAKDPKDRPATALEVVAALDAIAAAAAPARPDFGRRATLPVAAAAAPHGRWRAIGVITLAVVLAMAALAWWLLGD